MPRIWTFYWKGLAVVVCWAGMVGRVSAQELPVAPGPVPTVLIPQLPPIESADLIAKRLDWSEPTKPPRFRIGSSSSLYQWPTPPTGPDEATDILNPFPRGIFPQSNPTNGLQNLHHWHQFPSVRMTIYEW